MSIYASFADIGCDEHDQHDMSVLTYQGSHVYPHRGTHKPAVVGLCAIPAHCVPGQDEDAEGHGEWARLTLATWDEAYSRPMIRAGATVVLDRTAARALAAELTQWADMAEGGDES